MIRPIIHATLVALTLASPAFADLSQYGGPKPRPADLVIVSKGGADRPNTLMQRVIEQFNQGGMTGTAFQKQMKAAQQMNLPTKQGASYFDENGKMRTR